MATTAPKTWVLGNTRLPMRKDSSKYDGVADRNLLPANTLSRPSIVRAMPKVRSTDIDTDAPWIREMTVR